MGTITFHMNKADEVPGATITSNYFIKCLGVIGGPILITC
jgi:hypothetical protein